jgi:hypothetical protein
MFFAARRARRALKDPVSGEFRVTDWYDPKPNGSFRAPMLTGVVVAPGLGPVAGECRADQDGRWVANKVLPALVDRADPTRFVVLWKQVVPRDLRADARASAERAARDTDGSGA